MAIEIAKFFSCVVIVLFLGFLLASFLNFIIETPKQLKRISDALERMSHNGRKAAD